MSAEPAAQSRVKATVMDAEALRRSLSRIAHEIVERNRGAQDLVVVGIMSRGDVLARRLAERLQRMESREVASGALDPSGVPMPLQESSGTGEVPGRTATRSRRPSTVTVVTRSGSGGRSRRCRPGPWWYRAGRPQPIRFMRPARNCPARPR